MVYLVIEAVLVCVVVVGFLVNDAVSGYVAVVFLVVEAVLVCVVMVAFSVSGDDSVRVA